MLTEETQTALKVFLSLIASTVNEIQVICRSSICYLDAGDIERAFNISLNVGPVLPETDSLLQAASKIRRSVVEE